jgi:hypothetical protein
MDAAATGGEASGCNQLAVLQEGASIAAAFTMESAASAAAWVMEAARPAGVSSLDAATSAGKTSGCNQFAMLQ